MKKLKSKITTKNNKESPVNINIEFNIHPNSEPNHKFKDAEYFCKDSFHRDMRPIGKFKHLNKGNDLNRQAAIQPTSNEKKINETNHFLCGLDNQDHQDQSQKLNKNNMDIRLLQQAQRLSDQKHIDSTNLLSAFTSKVLNKSIFSNLHQLQPTCISKDVNGLCQYSANRYFKKKQSPKSERKDKINVEYHKRGNSQTIYNQKYQNSKSKQVSSAKNVKSAKIKTGNEQMRLKQKLQKFKLDMMKLMSYYQENNLMKSKLTTSELNVYPSSQLINNTDILSHQEAYQLHQKALQIRQYEERLATKDQVKEQYIDFKIKAALQQYQQQQSRQYLLQNNVEENKQTIEQKNGQHSTIKVVKSLDSAQIAQPIHSELQYQQKLNQFLLQYKQQSEKQQKHYFKIDEELNKEIQCIGYHKKQFLSQLQLQNSEFKQLEQWEEKYKNSLLQIKRKMWNDYEIIRSNVERRIIQNQRLPSKKKIKMMKSLSQPFLGKYSRITQFVKPAINKQDHQKDFLKFGEIDYFSINCQRRQSQYLPTIINDDDHDESQNSISTQQINQKVEFQPYQQNYYQEIDAVLAQQTTFTEETSKINLIKIVNQPILLEQMTSEQKEDVFQFIFMDMCIELYDEMMNQSRRQESQNKSSQRILKAISKYIKQQRIMNKGKQTKRIGIPTNLSTIRLTLQLFKQFALSKTVINPQNRYTTRQRLLKKLNTAVGPTDLQILSSLRINIFGGNYTQEQKQIDFEQQIIILDSSYFLYFENQIIKIKELSYDKYYESEEKERQRINFLRNCTHIHHKAIFDSLNDSLDYERIFGIWGKPFCWKASSIFHKQINEDSLEKLLDRAIQRTVRNAIYSCGLILNKQQSLIKDYSERPHIVNQLRDERLIRVLENFIDQVQEKWYFHDDELAQIQIQLSHLVWQKMILESIIDLQHVFIN